MAQLRLRTVHEQTLDVLPSIRHLCRCGLAVFAIVHGLVMYPGAIPLACRSNPSAYDLNEDPADSIHWWEVSHLTTAAYRTRECDEGGQVASPGYTPKGHNSVMVSRDTCQGCAPVRRLLPCMPKGTKEDPHALWPPSTWNPPSLLRPVLYPSKYLNIVPHSAIQGGGESVCENCEFPGELVRELADVLEKPGGQATRCTNCTWLGSRDC